MNANTLFRAGHIESWGRGIEKIEQECRNHGIEPPDYIQLPFSGGRQKSLRSKV